MNITELKPSHFTSFPFCSVKQKTEAEVVAQNINKIRKRLGDDWPLSFDQYKQEREKDGEFTNSEKRYFDDVIGLISDAEGCIKFCKSWLDSAIQANKAAPQGS